MADSKPLVGVAHVALLDGAVVVDRIQVGEVDGGALGSGVDAAAVLVRAACAVRELGCPCDLLRVLPLALAVLLRGFRVLLGVRQA